MFALATPVLAAAALILAAHGAPVTLDGVSPHQLAQVQTVTRCAPARASHVSVRWRGWHHHRHCHRVGRHWRCR